LSAREIRSMATPPPDAIVIGSGAGGAAAAYRLVQGGLQVLLLEKGTYLPTDGSTLDLRRVVQEGEFLSREVWVDGHGRSLTPEEHFNVGGKTKWYGAALARFAASEFVSDEAHGCLAWPIGLADLEPYYAEAERLLGVRAFASEPDLVRILTKLAGPGGIWRQSPLPLALEPDILRDPLEAMHFDGFASARGLKADAQSAFLAPLPDDARFTLHTGSEVGSLLGAAASGEGARTVAGVRLIDGREYRSPIVLLAAGALHSPRLLERYVTAAGLNDELPAAAHIGRYLKLHLLTVMVGISARHMSDVIRKTALIESACFPHSSVQPLGFDAELIASLLPRWVHPRLGTAVGHRSYGFFLQTEDGSSGANRVRDGSHGDSPVLDYYEGRLQAARREHRRFTHAFQRALVRAGLLGFTRRIGLTGTAHACGTLVCGGSPADSVVNSEGRVHGLKGLYVVDGSVLPRSSRVNPALTIFAWALRVSDLIIRRASVLLLAAFAVGALMLQTPADAAGSSAVESGAAEQGMAAPVTAVTAIALTVNDLDRDVDFYSRVLDFRPDSERELLGEAYERLFGLFGAHVRVARLRLGEEYLELMQFLSPRGRQIPADMQSNDRAFQHVAIVVSDMQTAYQRLRSFNVQPASSAPQRLPDWNPNAGGIEAFYFRDPDGHFLELIAFPPGKGAPRWHERTGRLFLGIDHSAIVVSDTDASLRFYRDLLGLTVAGTSENFGTEQEHLNNVFGTHLRITTLRAAHGPGVELLEYLTPRTGRPAPSDSAADDLWYWQVDLRCPDPTALAQRLRNVGVHELSAPRSTTAADRRAAGTIVRDPDGHASLISAE
jgi:choline dehydrogenase-like flavoprotein/catechol 2,3-dioxygenase-like lactoylglutathione lyase family enzyme